MAEAPSPALGDAGAPLRAGVATVTAPDAASAPTAARALETVGRAPAGSRPAPALTPKMEGVERVAHAQLVTCLVRLTPGDAWVTLETLRAIRHVAGYTRLGDRLRIEAVLAAILAGEPAGSA